MVGNSYTNMSLIQDANLTPLVRVELVIRQLSMIMLMQTGATLSPDHE